MKTHLQKWIAMILCAAMCSGMLSGFAMATNVPEMQKRNLALNQSVTVSGTEVSDGRFTGEMAVDGEVSNTSRWSPAKLDNQWLVVDMGDEYRIDQTRQGKRRMPCEKANCANHTIIPAPKAVTLPPK